METNTCARAAIRALGASQIRAVANAGMGRAGMLPFWFGEPDEVTSEFIRAAFGPQGEGFVRGCFAASEGCLADGVARLGRALHP